MKSLPHISNPLDDARRRINDAGHHTYRAMKQDTAYEIKRAIDKLNESLRLLQLIQQDYKIADPATIDTSKRPDDPSLVMPDDW